MNFDNKEMTFGFLNKDEWKPTFKINNILFSLETVLIEEDSNYVTMQGKQMCEQFWKMRIGDGRVEGGMGIEVSDVAGVGVGMGASLKRRGPLASGRGGGDQMALEGGNDRGDEGQNEGPKRMFKRVKTNGTIKPDTGSVRL